MKKDEKWISIMCSLTFEWNWVAALFRNDIFCDDTLSEIHNGWIFSRGAYSGINQRRISNYSRIFERLVSTGF